MMADSCPSLVAFVDGGFLKAAGAAALGRQTGEMSVSGAQVVQWCEQFGQGGHAMVRRHGPWLATSSFLRAYWYDAAFAPTDPRYASQAAYFNVLASVPGLHLRLGHLEERTPKWHRAIRAALQHCGVDQSDFEAHFRFTPELHQKGVDALITLDLVRLAQQRVYDVAVLIAGDRDLSEAVRAAQDLGRRIILAYPPRAGVSTELRQLADDLVVISEADARAMLPSRRAPSTAARGSGRVVTPV
jgi:uncharacterized LabA/DUF88 family protein